MLGGILCTLNDIKKFFFFNKPRVIRVFNVLRYMYSELCKYSYFRLSLDRPFELMNYRINYKEA